jgi:hypothetical protein
VERLRLGARYYAEGLTVAAAAVRVGLSVERLQDFIDRDPPKLIYK